MFETIPFALGLGAAALGCLGGLGLVLAGLCWRKERVAALGIVVSIAAIGLAKLTFAWADKVDRDKAQETAHFRATEAKATGP